MPLDSHSSSAGQRHRLRTFNVLCEGLECPFRERLHFLFSQIEKEFEGLYFENLSLQEKLEALAASQPMPSGGGGGSGSAATTIAASTAFSERLLLHATDSLESGGDSSATAIPMTTKGFKTRFGGPTANPVAAMVSSTPNMSSSASTPLGVLPSKVKASHKLKAQTSRIVSSFKQPSVVSSIVREFIGHKDGVWQVATKTGQPIIGTASADRTACIWGLDTGRCCLQYTGHTGSVNSIKFHQSRDLVLTSSGDATAHIWQAAVNWDTPSTARKGHSSEEELDDDEDFGANEEREKVDVLRTPVVEFAGGQGHAGVVSCADWLPGGDQIITASWDRTAILWDVETKEALVPLTGHDRELTHASAHPSQRLVVTSSRDSTFRLWDFRDQIPAVSVFQGHSEAVTSTVFTRDDKVVSGSDDRTVKVWDLRNMRSSLTTIRTDAAVNRLAISGNGIIAIPHDNRHIRLFDLNGIRVARLPRTNRQGHRRMVSSVAWHEGVTSTTIPTSCCNLFSCGFDKRVLGWSVNL